MTTTEPADNAGTTGRTGRVGDDPSRLLDRKISLSRAALAWERVWPALWPPLAVAGVFLFAALVGLWEALPVWAHMVGLAAFLIGFGLALAPLVRLSWPTREDGRHRLDAASIEHHRTATGFEDTLSGTPSEATTALWRAHRARLAREIARLKVAVPSPKLLRRDPYALRGALILALIVAFAYAGPDWRHQLAAAFTPIETPQSQDLRLDAWITPPAYTGRAPIFLADGSSPLAVMDARSDTIGVPVGSELVLRFHGDEASEATLATSGSAEPQVFAFDGNEETPEFKAQIDDDTTLSVSRPGEADPVVWRFAAHQDQVPDIELAAELETTPDQTLKLTYSVKDDYGVVSADARFELANADEEPVASADPSTPHLEIEPPNFGLILPGLRTRDAVKEMFRDLTEHPWAGLEVDLTLYARDEAGQEGASEPETFTLPERLFRNPLARAVIEQRRNLVRRPASYEQVARTLNALSVAPERFIDESSVYLGLRTAYLRTRSISSNEDLRGAVDHLWNVALGIEDGNLSIAERNLRAAQEALAKALAEGASDEEIERLMDELRQALGEFLQALREQMERLAERGQQTPQLDGQFLESHDLSQMMDMIEQLAKSGARDAAQELLSQLQNLLENLEGGMMAQMSPEQSLMSELLDELGRMIGEQQQLMDDTFRQGQQGQPGQQGQQGQQGQMPMPGQRGRPGQQGRPGGEDNLGFGSGASLAERQRMLRDALEALRERLGQGGLNSPSPLDRAGEAMGDAHDDLAQGEPNAAVGDQREALDQLRQGAQSLAQELAEGLTPAPGMGRPGQTTRNGPTDPLGRPMRTTGPEFGLTVKVPDEIDAETARKLRDELQRRLGERFRRALELDYIERLLERF